MLPTDKVGGESTDRRDGMGWGDLFPPILPLIQLGVKKKKSHWKEKPFPGEEKSCVLSAENATVST